MAKDNDQKSIEFQLGVLHKEKLFYQAMLRDTLWVHFSDLTEGIIESVALGEEGAEKFDFSSLTFPMGFDDYMKFCAERYIADNYKEKYIKNFNVSHLYDLYERGMDHLEMDFPVKNKGQLDSWLRMRICFTVEEENGHILGMSFAKDITRDVRLREQERLSHDTVQVLADSYECIYYWDIRRNRMVVERTNEELEEFIENTNSKNFSQVSREYVKRYVAEEDQAEMLKVWSEDNIQAILPHKNIEAEYRKRLSDGQIRWMRCILAACEVKDGKVETIVHGLQDITEQKQLELSQNEMLKNALASAEQASQAKTDFLSRMSHDIRTPMNAIIGMTAIAATHMDDKERIADCLSKITLSSKHLLALINEVLDMSKLESNRLELSMEAMNIREMMFNLTSMLRMSINEKNHEIRYQAENLIHEDVICDGSRLQQIMVNLITNAIKYTPNGGKINVITRELPTRIRDYYEYQFIVEDNGIGMSEEFLDKIFQPFERAEDSRISKIHGTGLGTAIAQGIVKRMNGDIKVESKFGQGSRFIVTLPLRIQEREEALPETLLHLPVLVVDDEKNDCEVACEMLNRVGMKSEWVLSGSEAVEKIAAVYNTPDEYFTIFMDWKMPGMDGIETAKMIREKVGKDVPIIILTAYDWGDIEEQAREAGITGFLSKPISESKIYHTFERINKFQFQTPELMNEDKFVGKRILLAEDNDLNAEIARELLQHQGFIVDVAENGQIAIDMLLEKPEKYYSCVLMDVQMPVMDGYTATRLIRNETRDDLRTMPIIAMTADAFMEDIRKAYETGMNEHIAKPISVKSLLEVLNDFIE